MLKLFILTRNVNQDFIIEWFGSRNLPDIFFTFCTFVLLDNFVIVLSHKIKHHYL